MRAGNATKCAVVIQNPASAMGRRMIRQPAERVFCSSTAIAVLPALAVAILAICALTPIHRAAEKTWMARETLMRIRPDAPDLGTHEGNIAAQKRREVRAMLGLK